MFNSRDFKSSYKESKGVYIEFCKTLESMHDMDFQNDVKIAMCEAMSNCIEHGNCGDASKKVHLAYSVLDDAVRIIMRDEGSGFDIEKKLTKIQDCPPTEEHGRGLLLMYDVMDKIKPLGNGNGIYMYKRNGKHA